MKKQIKKLFSLMLAVLMVLSCWVWIAPEKAEAASESYIVSVTTIGEPNACEDGHSITFYDIAGNATTKNWDNAQNGVLGTESFTLDFWPAQIKFYVSSKNVATAKIGTVKINDVVIFDDGYELSATGGVLWESSTDVTFQYNGSVGGWNFAEKGAWTVPQIYEADGDIDAINLQLNPIGGEAKSAEGTFNKWKDQYGVSWKGSYAEKDFTYHLAYASGGEAIQIVDENNSKVASASGSKNTGTVTAEAALQMIHQYSENQGKIPDLYLVAKRETAAFGIFSAKTTYSSAKINLSYPQYEWKFYGNGNGTVASTPTTKIEMGGTLLGTSTAYANIVEGNYITAEKNYKYYGQSTKDYYPTGNVTKDGYTFYGFWTVQQPVSTSDMSNPYAFEKAFIQPIDKESYDNMTVEEQKLFYSAGVKWDPKNTDLLSTKENSKNVYYAWWVSDDITIKFYDINGKFIEEQTVKYGYTDDDITWPNNKIQSTYASGAYSYSGFTGDWENYDGENVDSDGYTFTHDLILTPVYEDIDFTDTYNVTVYNSGGKFNAYSKSYSYRDTVTLPSAAQVTPVLTNAQDYTYTFVGWSTSAPSDDDRYTTGNYHVMVEDGNFDENGKAVYLATDFTVRDNVSYYPVFRRALKSHAVTFKFMDATGSEKTVTKTFKYGEVITAPDNVPTEYATGGYGCTFESWTRNNADVNLASQTCVPNMLFIARYSDPEPTPYNVTFVYKNSNGDDISKTVEVNHGQFILKETLDKLNPAENYDNGTALVSYNGIWEYNGTRYNINNLTSFSPENHTTFTAVYENPQPFYTVTYVDGSKKYSERVLIGASLPTWMNKITNEDGSVTEEIYLPSMADTVEGRYTFAGWFDEPQADENFAKTNGNRYGNQGASTQTGLTTVTSDVTLYPQYIFGLFEYNIVFLNWNGAKLASGTFHYQQPITELVNDAVNAAKRPADKVYTYQFIGWDKKVPEFCEGGVPGSTEYFVAQYKPVYIYYDVEWYNDADDTTPLATSKYVYGDRMHTPSVSLTPPTGAPAGQSYVFSGWYYLDAEGNEQPFNRNLTVTGNMKFYADYTLTKKMWTVTINDLKNPEYSFTVQDGSNISELVSDPIAGYYDKDEHDGFVCWTTDEAGNNVFDIDNATITSDITLYAKYSRSAHDFSLSEITKYPTYAEAGVEIDGVLVGASTGMGEKLVWCSCSKESTKQTVEIPALVDEKLPGASVYVGTTKWTEYDDAEGDTNVVYAGKTTDLIVNTTDKGGHLSCTGENCTWCAHEAEFNPSLKGSGIQAIYAYAAKAETAVNPAAVTEWGEAVFNWASTKAALIGYYGGWENVPDMYKSYNANVTGKVGNLKVAGAPLEDGVDYAVYYKIVDKAGNVSYMRTGAFRYDAKNPVITVEGDSNLTKTKYCLTATVKAEDENGATFTVNEKTVDLTAGKYTITEPGSYRVVAKDSAGNRTSVSFIVLAAHDTREIVVQADCENGGSKGQVCYNCGNTVGEAETTPALGHKYKTEKIDPTCTENGYDKTYCERCDLAPVITEFAEDGTTPLYPALDHDLSTKVIKEPTCMAPGEKATTCSRCDYIERETLDIVPTAHNFFKADVLRATCRTVGERTQKCRACGVTVILAHGYENPTDTQIAAGYTKDKYNKDYALAAHTESTDYRITSEVTCAEDGSKTKYCTVCNDAIGESVAIDKNTVLHTWAVAEQQAPTATEQGYIKYECSVCHDNYVEYIDKIEQFTVKFLNEDGSAFIDPITKVKGETIAATAVAAPTKANSTDGKYKYTFAGWYTKNENGEYATKYNLPMTVRADVTLYAKFTESEIVYTVQFKVPKTYEDGKFSDYEVEKELVGAIGDVRVPAATPTFKADSYNTFEFTGWKRAGQAAGETFVITGDATYEAQFRAVPKTVDVVFMNGAVALKKVTVNVGGTAIYDGENPTKAADADYHYTFKGWNAALTNITVKTTVYAEFNSIAHEWDDGTVVQHADCVTPVITEFKCDCGYAKKVTGDALGHDESGEIKYDAATGENYKLCAREGCGVEIFREKASYEIRFLNYNNSRLQVSTVEANGAVTYTGETPTKPTDAAHSYKFAGWVDSSDNEYLLDAQGKVTLPNATKDETYTAIFTETDITYVVTFIDTNGDVVQQTECTYGESVTFTGDTTKIAVPDADANGHYAFSGWNKATTNITSDTLVRATYSQAEHSYVVSQTGATCETAGGNKHECSVCKYFYIEGNVPATGHKWVVDYETAPDFDNEIDGKIVYKCSNGCGKTKEEIVNGHKAWIIVNAKDENGNPFSGARVGLFAKEADGSYTEIDFYITVADGIAKFYVKPGDYKIVITASGKQEIAYEVVVNADGTVSGVRDFDSLVNPAPEHTGCTCSCHKDSFWGSFFRFFQKIIKLFTGKPSCCVDYDSRI